LEIVIKFYDIRFDDNIEENKEEFKEEYTNNEINENLKNLISKNTWEKILSLTEHPNFKLNIFSTYIINYIKPEFLVNKMKEKANFIKQKKEELSDIKNYFNDKFGIVKVKPFNEISSNNNNNILSSLNSINILNSNNNNIINTNSNIINNINNNNYINQINLLIADSSNFNQGNNEINLINNKNINNQNFNGLQQQNIIENPENQALKGIWFSDSEMLNLKNYIKENIIGIGKLRNDISNMFKSINPYDEKDDYDMCNKRICESEINDDIDLIEIVPENDNFEDNYLNVNYEQNNNFSHKNRNYNNYSNSRKHNSKNKQEEKLSHDKERDECLDFAELGVMEVDDDIFENFDEENIPVIKNIYKRKKGSAEKFKTNQNNRNVFLSNQNNNNNGNHNNNHGNDIYGNVNHPNKKNIDANYNSNDLNENESNNNYIYFNELYTFFKLDIYYF